MTSMLIDPVEDDAGAGAPPASSGERVTRGASSWITLSDPADTPEAATVAAVAGAAGAAGALGALVPLVDTTVGIDNVDECEGNVDR